MESCQEFAKLIREWNAFELNGPVPARLDWGLLAATLDAAAEEIYGLRHDLSRYMDNLSQAENYIDRLESKDEI